MTRMKKSRTISALAIIAALVFTLVLAGCASANSYEGEWKATDVESPAKIHMDPSLTGSSLSFELDANGSGTMTLNGASVDITWSDTETGVTLAQSGGHELELTLDNGKLSMVDANGNTIFFEKQ